MTRTLNMNIEVLEPLLLMSASPAAEGADFSTGTDGDDGLTALRPNEVIDGHGGDDVLIAMGGDNVLNGGAGDDLLVSVRGNNVLDGGEGSDTAVYWGNRADYSVVDQGFGVYEIRNGHCVDLVSDVEKVQFQDGTYQIADLIDAAPVFGAPVAEISDPLLPPQEPSVGSGPIPADPISEVSISEPPSIVPEPPFELSEPLIPLLPPPPVAPQVDDGGLAAHTGNMDPACVDNTVPDAQKDMNQVRVSVDSPEPARHVLETIELTDSTTETIQLELKENSSAIFDFNTTDQLLTEDVWFLENDNPVANDEFQTSTQDDGRDDADFGLNLLANDADQFGAALTVSAVDGRTDAVSTWVAGSNGGAFFINADGTWNFSAEGQFNDLLPGESDQTQIEYLVDDGQGGTDTAKVVVRIDAAGNATPICVIEQRLSIGDAWNHGQGQEVVINLADSVHDADGDQLTYELNFESSFRLEGVKGKDGFFGWEVKNFDAATGQVTMQVYTERRDNWQVDASKISDVFTGGRNSYTPFSFTASDPSGDCVDCTFHLQVYDATTASPIGLDLNGDGEIGVTGQTSSVNKSGVSDIGPTVRFDIDNDGVQDTIEWFAGDGDGILIDNRDGNAANDMDGGRLFGDEGGKFANGYEKLAQLDTDGNGELEGVELDGLEIWIDDGDAVVEAGEFRTLQDLGVFKLNTNMSLVTDGAGRDLMQSTASVDAEAAGTVEYAISGNDADLFRIDAQTGELCFVSTPDYENPRDADGDNVYEVTLERVVNGQSVSQTVEIAICDKVANDSTQSEAVATGNVLDNDVDADGDTLAVSLVTGPQNGAVTLNSDGSYEYRPNDGFVGIDTFTYEVCDANGGTDTAEVCIEVRPDGNDNPDAQDDSETTTVDVSVSGSVAGNDRDPDGDTLTFSLTEAALNGAVALADDGTYTYTPNAAFIGIDTFSYTADDGNGGSDTAVVTILIEPQLVADPPPPAPDCPVDPVPVNDDPVATNDNATTDYNTAVTGQVLTNDVDPDGDALTAVLTTGPQNGTVQLGSDGSYVYTPNDGFSGHDSFTYEVSDGNGGTDTADVCVTVGEPASQNLGPDAQDDANRTTRDVPVTGTVVANDSDPDGDQLSYTLTGGPTNGTVVLNGNGTYTYTPNTRFIGVDTFTYEVSDGNGGTDAATVTITIEPELPDEQPVSADPPETVVEDGVARGVTGEPLLGSVATDGGSGYALVTTTCTGWITLNADGSFDYRPPADFTGPNMFSYMYKDASGKIIVKTQMLVIS